MKRQFLTRMMACALAVTVVWGVRVLPVGAAELTDAEQAEWSMETEDVQTGDVQTEDILVSDLSENVELADEQAEADVPVLRDTEEAGEKNYLAPGKPVWSTETPGTFTWQIYETRELFYGTEIYRDGKSVGSSSYTSAQSGEKSMTTDDRFQFKESGIYTVKIFAYETDEFKDPVAESEMSDEFVYTLPKLKLATPVNLKWSKESDEKFAVASCDKVDNAGKYHFEIYEDGKRKHGYNTFNNQQDLSKYVTDADTHAYTFTVEAYAKDITKYAFSEKSEYSANYADSVNSSVAQETIKTINPDNETDSAKVAEDVATIKALENSDLQATMQNNSAARATIEKVESNHKAFNNITENAPVSSVPEISADQIKVVGAALNVNSGSVQLNLREADSSDNEVINTDQYKSVLAFNMDVQTSEEKDFSAELDVPVCITLPVPHNMNVQNLVILHYAADGSVEKIKPAINSDGTVMFTITHFSLFAFAEKLETVVDKFNDIKESDWFVKAVQFAYDNGIMAGTGEGFGPNNPLTREQFAQVLYNHKGKPAVTIENKFPDVDVNQWYKSSVLWANENGIASGNGDGSFGVGQNITREALALMLYKYAKLSGFDMTATEGAIEGFADTANVSSWAQEALNWAVTKGIMSGKGSGDDRSTYRLDPQGEATRAECASMMKKLLEMKK